MRQIALLPAAASLWDPDFSPAQRERLRESAREAFTRYPHAKDLLDAIQHPEEAADVEATVDLMLAAGVPLPPKMLWRWRWYVPRMRLLDVPQWGHGAMVTREVRKTSIGAVAPIVHCMVIPG